GHRAHGKTSQQAALDQRVRIVTQNVAVLTGAGLGFVGIDNEIARTAIADLGHERPFHACREARAATAAQSRRLHLVDDPVTALFDDALGAIPATARHRARQRSVEATVDIGKDAILVLKHRSSLKPASCRRRGYIRPRHPWRAPWPA